MKQQGHKPDFIGIGAQKAGTSWLTACLRAHPQIWMPMKEIGFFSEWYEAGLERYEWKFRKCPKGKLTGEFSTSYLCTEGVAQQIKNAYPDIKIIAVLRHPVSRALSYWRHCEMRGRLPDLERLFEWSRYSKHVPIWQELFGKNLHLVDYRSMWRYPHMELRYTYSFLGLHEPFIPSIVSQRVNTSTNPRSVWAVRVIDHVGKLRDHRPFKWVWWHPSVVGIRNVLKRMNSKGFQTMHPDNVSVVRRKLEKESEWYENWVSNASV